MISLSPSRVFVYASTRSRTRQHVLWTGQYEAVNGVSISKPRRYVRSQEKGNLFWSHCERNAVLWIEASIVETMASGRLAQACSRCRMVSCNPFAKQICCRLEVVCYKDNGRVLTQWMDDSPCSNDASMPPRQS
jgi:hypothetical protein